MPRLAQLAVKLLKLPDEKDELAAKLARLERQLAQTREGRDTAKTEKRKLERQLVRELTDCREQMAVQADVASKQARAACTGACSCHSALNVPDVVNVPPSSGDMDDPPSLPALKVVAAIRGVLVAMPPSGVEPGYIERFFQRYHRQLVRVVAARMPLHPAAEA